MVQGRLIFEAGESRQETLLIVSIFSSDALADGLD